MLQSKKQRATTSAGRERVKMTNSNTHRGETINN